MKRIILILFTVLNCFAGFCQFERIQIETDSSEIEIIENSVYRCYEETFKNKDSIWWNVTYIDDPTKLHTEGWKTKSGKYLGIWKEFNRKGDLMYEHDHDKGTCNVNKSLYPHHKLLEQMRKKADDLIISIYSEAFFKNNVRFNFNCFAYDEEGYVGSWMEPLKRKPNKFIFRYQVKLATSDWYDDMIGIELDENGKYIPNEGTFNNYGFEKVDSEEKIFNIDKNKAIEIAKKYGLKHAAITKVHEFLTWEKFKKPELFNGQFRYYITELIDEVKYNKGEDRKGIIFKFNVYSFNPWTGKFIEKKKMKSIEEWGKESGHSTGLLPDDD